MDVQDSLPKMFPMPPTSKQQKAEAKKVAEDFSIPGYTTRKKTVKGPAKSWQDLSQSFDFPPAAAVPLFPQSAGRTGAFSYFITSWLRSATWFTCFFT